MRAARTDPESHSTRLPKPEDRPTRSSGPPTRAPAAPAPRLPAFQAGKVAAEQHRHDCASPSRIPAGVRAQRRPSSALPGPARSKNPRSISASCARTPRSTVPTLALDPAIAQPHSFARQHRGLHGQIRQLCDRLGPQLQLRRGHAQPHLGRSRQVVPTPRAPPRSTATGPSAPRGAECAPPQPAPASPPRAPRRADSGRAPGQSSRPAPPSCRLRLLLLGCARRGLRLALRLAALLRGRARGPPQRSRASPRPVCARTRPAWSRACALPACPCAMALPRPAPASSAAVPCRQAAQSGARRIVEDLNLARRAFSCFHPFSIQIPFPTCYFRFSAFCSLVPCPWPLHSSRQHLVAGLELEDHLALGLQPPRQVQNLLLRLRHLARAHRAQHLHVLLQHLHGARAHRL